jgi:D-3-phosphoglycerate dehydrogenase / 2-oxoglutarate reductase
MTAIVTTSPGFGRHGGVREAVAERGWSLARCTGADALAPALGGADFLVAGLLPVTRETLATAPRLRGVLKHGVGTDSIDIAACTRRGVPVTSTPGANADAVAELALGLMFALARNIPAAHLSVASGGWDRRIGTQLGGKCLGIVGLGNIGRRLARLARGIGMTVAACDPLADRAFADAHGIDLLELDALLARADHVSLHVSGDAENAALIDAHRIARMKRGACLLNLARGEVIDADAVAAALASGHLGGVAIDAFAVEPPDVSHPLFGHPRAIFTPHSGADTLEALETVGLMIVEDIDTLLAGRVPARCLNAGEL